MLTHQPYKARLYGYYIHQNDMVTAQLYGKQGFAKISTRVFSPFFLTLDMFGLEKVAVRLTEINRELRDEGAFLLPTHFQGENLAERDC
ncbi:hypothetical protein F2P81_017015 [Scophthalmus maximus]|uniref:Uncharacterized protein n=1 Tax=Scophthalmus maximus TaxID=52904 RepID=A0A6A4SH85_SCOMX|nr:hypothetical protein F2P81_017015 [Scophthalmus maximus]